MRHLVRFIRIALVVYLLCDIQKLLGVVFRISDFYVDAYLFFEPTSSVMTTDVGGVRTWDKNASTWDPFEERVGLAGNRQSQLMFCRLECVLIPTVVLTQLFKLPHL